MNKISTSPPHHLWQEKSWQPAFPWTDGGVPTDPKKGNKSLVLKLYRFYMPCSVTAVMNMYNTKLCLVKPSTAKHFPSCLYFICSWSTLEKGTMSLPYRKPANRKKANLKCDWMPRVGHKYVLRSNRKHFDLREHPHLEWCPPSAPRSRCRHPNNRQSLSSRHLSGWFEHQL